ncbi:MAG: glycine betaine ABC transporter substrate-binding protein [bacterium]
MKRETGKMTAGVYKTMQKMRSHTISSHTLKMIFRGKVLIWLCALLLTLNCATAQKLIIGSKAFPESHVLAEIMAQLLEDRGFDVERKFGLGGTIICYEGLVNGEIDIYPEYSGTIEQAILKLKEGVPYPVLQDLLKHNHDLELLSAFGFNNTYALTVRAEFAEDLDLKTISDLSLYPELRFGLSQEFLERGDGWGPLAKKYGLTAIPLGMEHALSYPALDQNKIDVMDVYSTDAEIQRYDLFLLEDELAFFPIYLAAPLVRTDLNPKAKAILEELAGKITEPEMQRLNSRVAIDGKSFPQTAREFLRTEGLLENSDSTVSERKWQILGLRTLTHLKLVTIALIAAMLVAIPLGIWIYKSPKIAMPVLYFTGLLQTIPAIALLAFMIAPFGIGLAPALIALFLYALLPILRNTVTALNTIDPVLRKVSVGMGLTSWQRLRTIEIPLAMSNILAGIRTSAVISVGTATLAAFIGAGGLGQYIFTGVTLNDPVMIMWGAIPAAILAIGVELGFEALERAWVPKHLQQREV